RVTGPIADALGQSIARSIPVPTVSPAFAYSFNPETGAFERETAIQGQVLVERPDVLGRGVWNLSISYERVRLDTVDGRDVEHLSDDRLPIIDGKTGALFVVHRFAIDLSANQVIGTMTYGVRDDLDVSLTVPLVYS